ncbi:MAG TPA: hypothetical protein VK891_13900 [Euzebyales bacterium]|nr:hypothetical protein [Euzebyales bacterium]
MKAPSEPDGHGGCDPHGISTDAEDGLETIELALVSVLIVVMILAVYPTLANGVGAAFQTVVNAFATIDGG